MSGITSSQRNLPTLEPHIYSGDPTRYRQWLTEFQALIEKNVTDSYLRLFYLKKYTSGPAREAVDGQLQICAPSSYETALALLQKRFGEPQMIAEAYRRRLELWEVLDDENCESTKLRRFSDFLDTCRDLKDGFLSQHFSYWDLPQFIRNSVLSKLPKSVSSMWNNRLSSKGIKEYYSTLTDCVRDLADQMCNPCYIYPGSPLYETIEREIQAQPKCKFCKSSSHKLHRCDKLQNISVSEQRLFIQKNGLCFSCLQKNHTAKNCPAPVKCTICNLKHPTSLHRTQRYDNSKPRDLETRNGLLASKTRSDPIYSADFMDYICSFLRNHCRDLAGSVTAE